MDNKKINDDCYEVKDIAAMRQIVVDYMFEMFNFEWTPAENFSLTVEKKYNLNYEKGNTYYGLPYSSTRVGSVEEFKSYMKDGVYYGPTDVKVAPGNHCTSSIFQAWAKIGNSVTARWSKDMLPSMGKGVIPVGSYKWKDCPQEHPEEPTTKDIIKANSIQDIFKAYSLLDIGDAILRREPTWGHARVICEKPVIVTNEDGIIDGDKSFVTTIEQTSSWDKKATINTTFYVNHKYTFNQLLETNYIPVTCSELLSGKVEKQKVELLPEICQCDLVNGLKGKVLANYDIFWVQARIKDSRDKIIYTETKYPFTTTREYELNKFEDLVSAVSNLKDGEYNFDLILRIKTDDITVTSIKFIKKDSTIINSDCK